MMKVMAGEKSAMSFTQQGMPTHQQLGVPVIRVVVERGASRSLGFCVGAFYIEI